MWRCGGCGFVANTAKVAALVARLEEEVRLLDRMEEATAAQVRTKAASYQSFLDKKAKLLPPSSYLLLNAAASLCLLLARLRPDPCVLGVRESWTRRRLRAMQMVEGLQGKAGNSNSSKLTMSPCVEGIIILKHVVRPPMRRTLNATRLLSFIFEHFVFILMNLGNG